MDWMEDTDTSQSFQAAARDKHLSSASSPDKETLLSSEQMTSSTAATEVDWTQTLTHLYIWLKPQNTHELIWGFSKLQHEYFIAEITESLAGLHQRINCVEKICW